MVSGLILSHALSALASQDCLKDNQLERKATDVQLFSIFREEEEACHDLKKMLHDNDSCENDNMRTVEYAEMVMNMKCHRFISTINK